MPRSELTDSARRAEEHHLVITVVVEIDAMPLPAALELRRIATAFDTLDHHGLHQRLHTARAYAFCQANGTQNRAGGAD